MQRPRQSNGNIALVGPVVLTVGSVIVLVASFRRWLTSGTVGRSSYELLGLVHRLGFAPSGASMAAVESWPLMPLLITSGVVAVWWGWRVAGAALSAIGGVYAGAVGGVVAFAAPSTRGVELSSAPAATAVGAGVVVIGALLVVVMPTGRAAAASRGARPDGPS
ncbi:MAG: hypothetical protein ABIW84_09165 [Ilumatobacteraceae bacterium]